MKKQYILHDIYKMNYENTQNTKKGYDNQKLRSIDTQNKFTRALKGLCQYSSKVNDVTLSNHLDAKKFLTQFAEKFYPP